MKNVYAFIVVCFILLVQACALSNKQPSVSQAPAPTAQPQPLAAAKEIVAAPQAAVVANTTSPAADAPADTASARTSTVDFSSTSKTDEQPLQSTAPTLPALKDIKQFKEEELISLEGRHLNPLLQAPASTQAQQAPWKNEQLKFGVYYSFVKAGTAYIKNQGLADIDGRPAYLIQTSAFSAPVIDAVFKVRDVNYSWIDAADFYSRGYSQSLREGNYKRDEWVIFDYADNSYHGEVKKKAEPREVTGQVTQPVLDILSALYYVRTQPLTPGQEVVFDIVNREEQYPLVVKVTGRETVKTAAGKFKCIVVEPQFRGEGIFVSKGKSLKVWLTDDKRKMPVKMKTEVFIGSVSAELLEYKRN